MNWQQLYLTADGRIGQKDFWIGFLILFVAGIIAGLVPVIGPVLQLVLIYPGVCLTSKRLHDMGKTGWLAAVPYGISAVITLLAAVAAITAMMAASGSAAGVGGFLALAGMIALVGTIGFLVALAFLLWVGLSKGDAGTNKYGPPPVSLIGGTATA